MKRSMMVLVMGLIMAQGMQAAPEVNVPVVKADMLAINDAAISKDAQRKAAGVGVMGRVWGYVKDGVTYMASSTSEAVVEHPYLTAASIAAAVFIDKNNNYTGLWKKSSGDGAGSTVSGNTTSVQADDHSVRTEVNGNSGNVTIIVQSGPMTDALK